ncbi:hypothetical protein ACGYWN_26480 [Burkholderia pseudomallei]|uniref:hypothetical protein n=1 Tax=Burkholderia pseudomallei TaxID=28450 RepID=UPI00016B1EDA|nr:hypothetical protein [Burkholderia pseudomallei]AIP59758.1 hypothetical protein DR54_2275 [Burkholderia pseudomallei HBPUB10303a]AJX38421.1 hypothetical protein DP45_01476 [Burkholderia pseudomallei]MBF3438209.1 hypothetical protein [Burkholderia pseudomallei]MBF3486141.1 hypothetical protein [Burkholderia pseudomallei]MBF3547969.1 hypothetical protein [Burkholderia pseudomallei]
MTRPSFQFYPGDWQANSNLRRCTHAEKGVWIDVMCLLHDSEEYGVLRWPLKEIAQAIGAPLATLRAIVHKGVLKGADNGQSCAACIYVPRSGRRDGDPVTLVAEQEGPIWYSSRMVKDEYVRAVRGESSRFQSEDDGAPKSAPKPPLGDSTKASPKPPLGDGSSSSSSSSSSKKETRRAPRFDAQAHLVSLGVDQMIAADWLKTRKGKRLAPTQTSLDRVAAEAAKAGMSMAAAVKLACENGWGGFKADWLADSPPRANGRSSDNPFA